MLPKAPFGVAAACCPLSGIFARAAEIAGVPIPDRITGPTTEAPLVLIGAGVRKKLYFKTYFCALYLPSAIRSAETILGNPGPNQMLRYCCKYGLAASQSPAG